MAPLLFVSPIALPHRPRRACANGKTCLRRPRTRIISSITPDEPREVGEPSWMDLARSLGASDNEPERAPPEWKLPDDEEMTSNENSKSAWDTWNAAISKEDRPTEGRDPRKETDFWMSAARDISADVGGETPEQSAEQSSTDLTDSVEDATSSTEIWRMARGVTGEMSSLQERLRIDLENFNPDENTDQYRDIARELVGPPEEIEDKVKPARDLQGDADLPGGEGQDAEAGSGWNPDVDWMRFEDLRREQVKKLEADARKQAAQEAQEKKVEAIDKLTKHEDAAAANSGREITYTDESGRVLTPEEVEQARREGAVFLDEGGSEIDALRDGEQFSRQTSPNNNGKQNVSLPDGSAPGFITNRFKSRGTYGSGYSGIEDDINLMREQGIPLRDPKADAERWRSAAKELNFTVDEVDNTEDIAAQSETEDEILAVTQDEESKHETTAAVVESADSETDDSDESSSWSMWREGARRWQNATEDAKPRDPKAEVDMWRSSARELTEDEQTSSSPRSGNTVEQSSEDGNVWETWRSANASWTSAVAKADANAEGQSTENRWASKDSKSDWGAGLDGKASSDRAAWENWSNASAGGLQSGSSLWWPSESESGSNQFASKKPSINNADQWRAAAIELTGLNTSQTAGEEVSGEARAQRMEQDTNLDFWKNIAKGMTLDDREDSKAENDQN